MDKLMKTLGETFVNPTPEAIAAQTFAIIWDNTHEHHHEVRSPFGWSIIDEPNTMKGLRDRHGKTRYEARWGEYHPAVQFSDWTAYDVAQMESQLEKLEKALQHAQTGEATAKKQVQRLETTLTEAYDITTAGGPNSRRNVKALIAQTIDLRLCQDCGCAFCTCA